MPWGRTGPQDIDEKAKLLSDRRSSTQSRGESYSDSEVSTTEEDSYYSDAEDSGDGGGDDGDSSVVASEDEISSNVEKTDVNVFELGSKTESESEEYAKERKASTTKKKDTKAKKKDDKKRKVDKNVEKERKKRT